jgi:hypothetical protein
VNERRGSFMLPCSSVPRPWHMHFHLECVTWRYTIKRSFRYLSPFLVGLEGRVDVATNYCMEPPLRGREKAFGCRGVPSRVIHICLHVFQYIIITRRIPVLRASSEELPARVVFLRAPSERTLVCLRSEDQIDFYPCYTRCVLDSSRLLSPSLAMRDGGFLHTCLL